MEKIEITFNGNIETYAYEDNLDYEQAKEFCKKNGGILPTRWFLWEYDHDHGKCRWELLEEKLKEVEDEEFLWTWTSDEYDPYRVWNISLATGETTGSSRGFAHYNLYALCVPAFYFNY